MFRLPFLALLLALAWPSANAKAQDKLKATTNRVWSEERQQFLYFYDHQKLKARRAELPMPKLQNFKAPTFVLPIDWAKNLSFPMLGNDRYGDCFYVSAAHHDQTFTGNVGPQSVFDVQALVKAYLRLSGGDNGLNDDDIQEEWSQRGLANIPEAKAIDYLYVDLQDAKKVQSAIYLGMGLQFTLATPNKWINNSQTGAVWDAPATPNQSNGHAVHINGVDDQGRYKVQTWGSYVWMTHAGMQQCDPSAFVVFSTRAINDKGYAGNGLHITELAKLWKDAGGKTIDVSILNKYPPPAGPPDPPQPPGPGPSPKTGSITISIPGFPPLVYQIVPNGTKVLTPEGQEMLKQILDGNFPPVPKKESKIIDYKGSGYFRITLPEDAKLWVDGKLTRSTGRVRVFNSPPLEQGERYAYKIKATWDDDGIPVEVARTVYLWAFKTTEVTLYETSAKAETLSN